MKTINNFLRKILCCLFFTGLCINFLHAQDKIAIKDIVDARQFIFHAQMALPSSGPSRSLTPEYDLKILKDTVISYLPFFGRAYSAPINDSEGGF